MSKHHLLPDIQSLDSSALLFQPIIALLTGCSWHLPHLTMALLISGLHEIVSRILQSCDDFPQLVALAATCKRLHSLWLPDTATLIWHVGRSSILAFDDALIAVSLPFICVFPCCPSGTSYSLDMNRILIYPWRHTGTRDGDY
jgi:hypothetical protein